MRKQKFTRLACLILALLLLVSGATVAVSANNGSSGVTDKSIKDYADELNTISYQSYMSENFELFQNFSGANLKEVKFDAISNLVFTDRSGNTIVIKNGTDWTMTVGKGDNKVVYTSLEDAIAAGYEKKDLVFVDKFDGKDACDMAGKTVTAKNCFASNVSVDAQGGRGYVAQGVQVTFTALEMS